MDQRSISGTEDEVLSYWLSNTPQGPANLFACVLYLFGWLVGWLVSWSVGWLFDCFVGLLVSWC